LWAARSYAAAPDGPNNIALLYTVDEEISRTGIRAFIHEHLPALPWRPVGAVVGEPSTLRLVTAHKGDVRLTVRTEGMAAHSSDPSRGRSAIRMMRSVLEALEDRYIPSITASHPLTGPAMGSVNVIRGGSQVNVIPRYCEIEIDRRIVPGEDPSAVLAEIEALFVELRRDDPDLRVSVHDTAVHAPLDPAGGEAFARRVGERLEAIGRSGEPTGVGYGSDAGDLTEADIPTVVLGPGDIAQAHGPDEWLELEELDGAVAAYGSIMRAEMDLGSETDRAS